MSDSYRYHKELMLKRKENGIQDKRDNVESNLVGVSKMSSLKK